MEEQIVKQTEEVVEYTPEEYRDQFIRMREFYDKKLIVDRRKLICKDEMGKRVVLRSVMSSKKCQTVEAEHKLIPLNSLHMHS